MTLLALSVCKYMIEKEEVSMEKSKQGWQWAVFWVVLALFIAVAAVHIFSVKVVLPSFSQTYTPAALGLPYTDSILFLPAAWLFGGYLVAYLFFYRFGKGVRRTRDSAALQKTGPIILTVACLILILAYVAMCVSYLAGAEAVAPLCVAVGNNPAVSLIPGCFLGCMVGSTGIQMA